MADKNDYTSLLGERIERAYRLKDDIKPPSAEDIARWKRLAQAKRKEKRRRMKLIASLASVFAVVFCVSIVPMFKIPDAQAGEDYFVDMELANNYEDTMTVNTYKSYEELPEEVLKEFLVFDVSNKDYALDEIQVTDIDNNKKVETTFKNNKGDTFSIRQCISENNTETIVNSDYVENWNGLEVYVKEYTSGKKNINYKFAIKNSFIDITSDRDIDKEVIKNIIIEAAF